MKKPSKAKADPVRAYLARIGAKGGASGRGVKKSRSEAMRAYWAEVRAGLRPGPRRGNRRVGDGKGKKA